MSKTKHRKPKTYETTLDGKKTQVTIPENPVDDDTLEALKDNLSPEAVAAIAAYLVAHPAEAPNKAVNRELNWFTDRLLELVGGDEAFNQLCEDIGL